MMLHLTKNPAIVECIQCSACKTYHRADGEDFFAVHGNITTGLYDGIVGNNLDVVGKVVSATYFCRKQKCLSAITKRCFDAPISSPRDY
jgi:hypothetical protein